MVSSLYGSDISDPVIQDLAAKLYKVTVVKSSKTMTSKDKELLAKTFISIQSAMISVSQQIAFVQSKVFLLTGTSINLSSLDFSVINNSTGKIETLSGSSTDEEEVRIKLIHLKYVNVSFRTFLQPKQ